MDSIIQRFAFDHKPVRVTTEDDILWFVAKDVADALEYSEYSNPARLFQIVPEEWKGVKPIHTPYGTQNMVSVTEQGLYFFLARSDKKKAIPFQKWLAGEVVPSIRKHGAYMTPEMIEKTLTNPDWKWAATGKIPKGIKISHKSHYWKRSEIEQLIDDRRIA